MNSFRNVSIFWFVGSCLLAGCGGAGDRPELGTVTGVVTMDDKPLPNVWVMFIPSSGRTSIARTDENGAYDLKYLEGANGAKIDSHTVSIATYHEDEIEELRYNSQEPVTEPIPAKYNSKTTLKADVVAGANVIDFKLESK
ncbi:MAG: hypothetical protein KDB01_20835 [Planctomycetaceae bacterium]|nr:hypothetical protein [Planctomycetaceae bacterium]